ncbi:MAG TPA: CoA pyrophosphatase [Hyphomicrobiaceae bacterium]|nr:CoA pyrophosphatase [Hyphomicrobiaceae bacterium]
MQPANQIIEPFIAATDFRRHVLPQLSPAPSSRILTAPVPQSVPQPSDFDLNPGLEREVARKDPPRPAAVLVPVIAREPLTVLFTLRTAHLASHAGQVSFPGGKIDDDDENAIATALREAHEEVALLPEQIEPLGFLDTYHTSTGYSVAPLVALVDPHHTAVPNPDEVADIFEVPLAFLMAPENIALNARMWQGRERHFYAFTFGPRYIWGATAGILNNMRTRLFT